MRYVRFLFVALAVLVTSYELAFAACPGSTLYYSSANTAGVCTPTIAGPSGYYQSVGQDVSGNLGTITNEGTYTISCGAANPVSDSITNGPSCCGTKSQISKTIWDAGSGTCVAPTGTWTATACNSACGTTAYSQPYTCTGGNGLCSGAQPADVSCAATASCAIPDCTSQTKTWGAGCSVTTGVVADGASTGSLTSGAADYVGTATFTCNGSTNALTLTAGGSCSPNQPPTAPTITGPTTGITVTNYTYTFTATDPESDTLHYEIDWDNNGSVDQVLPAGYVSSGTPKSQANNWAGPGVKSFQARAVDVGGHTSGWTPYTVTIGCPTGSTQSGPSCIADVAIANVASSFSASPATVISGNSSVLTVNNITGGGTITCTIDNGVGAISPLNGSTKNTGAITTGTIFTLTCGNGVGPNATANTTVSVLSATAALSTTPSQVSYGYSSTLNWSSTGASVNGCVAGGPWLNNPNTAGSGLTDPLTADTTFTFQCTGSGGTSPLISKTVTVCPSGAPVLKGVSCQPVPVAAAPLSGLYTTSGSLAVSCGAYPSNYVVSRGATTISSGPINGGQTITVPLPNVAGTYTTTCTTVSTDGHNFPSTTSIAFQPVPPGPIVSLKQTPSSIAKGSATIISWTVLYPVNTCTLTASAVCLNGSCNALQLAASSSVNTILTTGTTDANDLAGSRPISTAVKTLVNPNLFTTDWKAFGKKTLNLNKTMDFLLNCGSGVGESAKVRVQVTSSNEG